MLFSYRLLPTYKYFSLTHFIIGPVSYLVHFYCSFCSKGLSKLLVSSNFAVTVISCGTFPDAIFNSPCSAVEASLQSDNPTLVEVGIACEAIVCFFNSIYCEVRGTNSRFVVFERMMNLV